MSMNSTLTTSEELSSAAVLATTVSMPRVRLVKSKEFEAQLNAQSIRKRAEERADLIVKETLVRAAEIEAAARIKGEQIGLRRYAGDLLALDQARKTFASDVESQLIASVFSVVQQLLPTLPANLIMEDTVINLIRGDARSRTIQLIVPPAQVAYACSRIEAWRGAAGSARGSFSIEVKGDAQLGPDVCMLKSEFGSVSANIHEQLAALEESASAALVSPSVQSQSPARISKPKSKSPNIAEGENQNA